MLRGMWIEAHRWIMAANGDRKSMNNPIGSMLAKGLAQQAIDRYFAAIDALLPKQIDNKPSETT